MQPLAVLTRSVVAITLAVFVAGCEPTTPPAPTAPSGTASSLATSGAPATARPAPSAARVAARPLPPLVPGVPGVFLNKDLASGALPNVEVLRTGGRQPEAFLADRAVFEVPVTLNIEQSLGSRQLKKFVSGTAPTVSKVSTDQKPPHPRPDQLRPNQNTLVTLRPEDLNAILLPDAARLVHDTLHEDVEFASERGVRAMAYVLIFNSQQGDGKLKLDFVAERTQLLTSTSEGVGVANMASDDYWRLTNLRRAWPLALAAAPHAPAVPVAGVGQVSVAVIDQGMLRNPIGLRWDFAVGSLSDLDQPDGGGQWHGTDCGSVLLATVNDHVGAMGSALLSDASAVTVPKAIPRISSIAGVMPPGPVTLHTLAVWIDAAVFLAYADVVSVSYRTWCDSACRNLGDADLLEQTLKDADTVASVVVFSAGNDAEQIPRGRDVPYLVGCEDGGGALCVGAVERLGTMSNDTNYGDAVAAWAPGDWLNVNPLPDPPPPGIATGETGPRVFAGTSAAAPFVAGVIALAEVAWGRKFGTNLMRAMVKSARKPTGTIPGSVPVLDAEMLLRQNLVLAKDITEAGNGASPIVAKGRPSPVMTIDVAGDRDGYTFELDSGCWMLGLDVDYVPNPLLGFLAATLTAPGAKSLALTDTSGLLGALRFVSETPVGAGRYDVTVSQTAQLTTAYSFTVNASAAPPGSCDFQAANVP